MLFTEADRQVGFSIPANMVGSEAARVGTTPQGEHSPLSTSKDPGQLLAEERAKRNMAMNGFCSYNPIRTIYFTVENLILRASQSYISI